MRSELPLESDVLTAVRQFLRARAFESETDAAFGQLISVTSRLPVLKIGEWERRIRRELHFDYVGDGYSGVTPQLRDVPERASTWLDLCSGDGYQRERALHSLHRATPNAFLFTLLVRRLNDWVPEVRQAAHVAVLASASASDPADVAESLWYTFTHLPSWGRMEPDARSALLRLLSVSGVGRIFASRLRVVTAGPASAVLAQATGTAALDPVLLELAREAVQPAVRARAYRCILNGSATWVVGRRWRWTSQQWCEGRFEPVVEQRKLTVHHEHHQVLESAVADRSPSVRRVAGDWLVSHIQSLDPEALQCARRLAHDPYPSVADRGKYILSHRTGATSNVGCD